MGGAQQTIVTVIAFAAKFSRTDQYKVRKNSSLLKFPASLARAVWYKFVHNSLLVLPLNSDGSKKSDERTTTAMAGDTNTHFALL